MPSPTRPLIRIERHAPAADDPNATRFFQTIYPPATTRESGDVEIEATIGKDGLMKTSRVVSGPELLREMAPGSVQKWKFPPRLQNGEPTEFNVTIIVRFVR